MTDVSGTPFPDPPIPVLPAPVIDDCSGCGACCMGTPVPPFEPGEEARWNLTPAQLRPIRDRIAGGQQFDRLPCVWFDSQTRRCRHYEQRPDACRRFEPGSTLCRLSRIDIGLPG